MKQKYKFGMRLHKFYIEQDDMELFFFYNQKDSGIDVIVENEELGFQCIYQIPYQYFQKFQQQFKDKMMEITEEDLKEIGL